MAKYDFSGWATKANIRCSDGRVIMKDAFKHNNGEIVPLVWNHQHNDPNEVLGHALLENREEGVFAYGSFNDTEAGKTAKLLVQHGDVKSLSIYANELKQQGSNVIHGSIRELSLVLAGANKGARIENVLAHGVDVDNMSDDELVDALAHSEEACIFTGEGIDLSHAEEKSEKSETTKEATMAEETKKTENTGKEETVADVFETLTEKQKNVVYAIIGQAIEDSKNNNNNEGETNVKHNAFDQTENNENVLTHSDIEAIMGDAKRYGSLKDAVLQHGIEDIDWLFPEAKNLNTPPEFIKRDTGWVAKVMAAVHHTPFSRIKSMFANITEEDARAKGYIKGNLKKDEVFSLLKRTTTPTTVYKKQKLDRDDVVDITDFDVVAWIKAEMRMMLDEELARAFLIGDGRLASSDDKINEQNIRPIFNDEDLYTIKATVNVANGAAEDVKAKAFIKAAIRARKNYKGSGEPVLYTTEDVLTECLLIEDGIGHPLYDSVAKLANTLRVKEIVTVPVMEGAKGKNGGDLMGIIVNLKDYNVGADKGGAVNMFDDFDIDYNQQKYLIETRCSGALIKPYSAIALECVEAGA
ncbi:MAG: phage major capsid protein [Kiritimatiellae bacterium]|nr:phage major capsid protein [Kiritimatiellia bacterium]